MPKIVHYRNSCIGCGVCYQMQPAYWRMSKKDGKATLLNAKNKKEVYVTELMIDDEAHSKQVMAACPVRVIKIMQ